MRRLSTSNLERSLLEEDVVVEADAAELRVERLNALTHDTGAGLGGVGLDELVAIERLDEVRQNGGGSVQLGSEAVVLDDRVGSRLDGVLGQATTAKVDHVLRVEVSVQTAPCVRLQLLSQQTVELLRDDVRVAVVQRLVQLAENPQRTVFDGALHDVAHHRVDEGHLVRNRLGDAEVFHQLSPTDVDRVLLVGKFAFVGEATAVSTVRCQLVVLLNGVVGGLFRQVLPENDVALAERQVLQSTLQRLHLQRRTGGIGKVRRLTTRDVGGFEGFVQRSDLFLTGRAVLGTTRLDAIVGEIDRKSVHDLELIMLWNSLGVSTSRSRIRFQPSDER